MNFKVLLVRPFPHWDLGDPSTAGSLAHVTMQEGSWQALLHRQRCHSWMSRWHLSLIQKRVGQVDITQMLSSSHTLTCHYNPFGVSSFHFTFLRSILIFHFHLCCSPQSAHFTLSNLMTWILNDMYNSQYDTQLFRNYVQLLALQVCVHPLATEVFKLLQQ